MPEQIKQPFTPDLTFADRLVGKGLQIYGKSVDREKLPLNKRIFLESVVDLRKDPITAQSMTADERKALADVILNKYKPIAADLDAYAKYLTKNLAKHNKAKAEKNKDQMMYPEFVEQYKKDLDAIKQFKRGVITPEFIKLTSGEELSYAQDFAHRQANVPYFNVKPVIGYEDYGVPAEQARSIHSEDLPSALHTTFGQFSYRVDPKNRALVIQEDYDFNPYTSTITGQNISQPGTESFATQAAEGGRDGIYNLIRGYAGKVLPPGQGRPVNVQLNQLAPPTPNAFLR